MADTIADLKVLLEGTRRLYFIGMMGAGKGTLSRAVARQLGWMWMDTDACVERQSGMAIKEIFDRLGEVAFRSLEQECIRQTLLHANSVIACGGGAPCFFDTMDLLLSSGTVVYLNADIGTLLEHLERNTEKRPLLSVKDVRGQLSNLLTSRDPVYRRAHLTIDTSAKSVDEICTEILNRIGM